MKNNDAGLQPSPKVVLSFGLGRLHFVQAAEVIVAAGINLTCIQGWVPSASRSDALLDRLGALIGAPHLSKGLGKRRLPFLAADKNIGIAWPEFLAQILFRLNRHVGLARGVAASIGWRSFGRASKRHLKGQDIFHVRSGAGSGGAIAQARRNGAVVLADHSIAHPAFLERQLRAEFEAADQTFWMSPTDPFWGLVLQDCLDADHVVVNSHFVKRTFTDQGMNPGKISVIYLGVRSDFIGLKQSYAREPGPLRLLFTGQFGFRKGAHYLIDAIEKLVADGLDVELTVLGDASECAAMVATSGVSERIKLLGFVPQDALKDYLRDADIYVFPSLAEGCASSSMEALAAGLPTIATEETGLPSLRGHSAEIIASKSAVAIQDAVLKLADDEGLRETLGTNAANLIKTGFDWSDYGQQMAALYRDLADKQATQL